MASGEKRALKVFLCHASDDKPAVREFYKRLVAEGVDAWLDEEKLLAGQNWNNEILEALQDSDAIVICLSKTSVAKEGYVQREIKEALKKAEEKPSGTIFVIPAKLDNCEVPSYLKDWHWVELFAENGHEHLMRSLRRRASEVGAVIDPLVVEELEQIVEQLYTEGLAAFYTEDWNKACQRFQLILRERPNHKNAIEKLEQAERQRDLSKLYAQSVEACQAENWQAAIKALEELLKKSQDYKDSAQLFKNAKKQKQLGELYAEAKKFHAAKKWNAVLKVFEQIFAIDPSHSDPDGLLSSAQKEAAELKHISDLNDLYSQSVREMDLGKWYEARTLLEQVHKAQTGFLETEGLLRKVENEILKIEKINERSGQVNTLYEQAHGLLRSRNWRNALDKVEEIRKLDDQFEDKDEIVEKAKVELKREEQEVQKQNQLAAIYADAVRLLKEGKYQESWDKWSEVKAIDSKYPDRQQVQRVASKKLSAKNENITLEKAKSEPKKRKDIKISVAYPKLLSKRYASSFLLQIYLSDERPQVTRNIKLEFKDQKTNEYMQSSFIKPKQEIKVKFFSPNFNFSEPVTKLINKTVNEFTLLGMPKDNCEPGLHKVLVSISDGEQEFESLTIIVQVVDFAFDHISRPFLSKAASAFFLLALL